MTERWLPRLREIRGIDGENYDEWASSEFSDYDPAKPELIYGAVMEELFIQPEARQREVEELCDGRLPSFGYAVLAALLGRRDGLFNVALTTNFDDLIADAMYVFTEARPLVIHDELLAGFIRPTRLRPLVVKVHGDHRLSPRNTETETKDLKRGISEGIGNLLHDRGVIFVGYGGNDTGIAELLASLPAKALPLGVWWASSSEPDGVLRDWLEERGAIWVQSPGFDELMLLFKSEFEVPNPTSTKFDQIFDSYLSTYRDLEKQVIQIPDSDPQASSLKDAAARSEASTEGWARAYLQAARAEDDDPGQAEEILKEAMAEFPDVVQLPNSLSRLALEQTHYEDALHWSQRAMAINPDARRARLVRAQALSVSGRTGEAFELYRGLIEADPNDPVPRVFLGIYLVRDGSHSDAEQEFDRLVELDADKSRTLVGLLADELGVHDQAAALHERAIKEEPENGAAHTYYAQCLMFLGRRDEALEEIETARRLLSRTSRGIWLMLLFFELVIASTGRKREAMVEMRRMIDDGVRLATWNFDSLLDASEDSSGSRGDWLVRLAEVIRQHRDPEILEGWDEWREAA